jgi:hypothetical protein
MGKIPFLPVLTTLFFALLLVSSCSRIQDPAPTPGGEILPEGSASAPAEQMPSPESPTAVPPVGASTPATPTLETPAAGTTSATPTLEITESLPASCTPTSADALGPFYEPDAPVRDKVGEGYVLSGVVRAADGCAPIPGAQIEIWMAGPDGNYADDYRATLFSDENGAYRFESHSPPAYGNRPPHHHLRVTAAGFQALVTQNYPLPGQTEAVFDLVLIRE